MSGFINHLLSVHFNTGQVVKPRLKGAFESNSAFQQAPATDVQHTFETTSTPTRHKTVQAPVNPQASGVQVKSFKGVDSKNETKADLYTTDDSHLLIPPSKTAQPNTIIESGTPAPPSRHNEIAPLQATEKVNDFVVSDQKKPTTEHPGESKLFTNPTVTFNDSPVADAGFISKKNTAFSPMPLALSGQGIEPHASNNLAWVKVFKNTVNNYPQGNTSIVESQSVIKVNIGRIDVRAVTQQQPSPRETATTKPGISLSDFLKNKNGNK